VSAIATASMTILGSVWPAQASSPIGWPSERSSSWIGSPDASPQVTSMGMSGAGAKRHAGQAHRGRQRAEGFAGRGQVRRGRIVLPGHERPDQRRHRKPRRGWGRCHVT
jgi:hypothetical protein